MDYLKKGIHLFTKAGAGLKILFIPNNDNDYRPKFLQGKLLLCVVLVVLLVRIISLGFFISFPHNIFFADISKVDLVNLLNKNRQDVSLKPLAQNNALDQAAFMKAQDMVQNNYFAHQSPQGVTPWFWFAKAGYRYKYAGENLAVGFIDSSEIFNAWFNSPSHKANLLNPNYKEVGTAIVSGFGTNNAIVVVQLFGGLPAKTIKVSVPNHTQNIVTKEPSETPAPNSVAQKVLGNSSQIIQLNQHSAQSHSAVYGSVINFIAYDYEKLITDIAYGFLAVIIASLLINIVINITIQRAGLIAKSMALAGILVVVILLNHTLVSQFVLHQMII